MTDQQGTSPPQRQRAEPNTLCYLVVGSSGHLGEALMRTLPERIRSSGSEDESHISDVKVVGIDRRAGPLTTHVIDISSLDSGPQPLVGAEVSSMEVLFESYRFDGIFHTAALQKPHVDSHTEQQFIRTNLLGTQRLIDLAVAHQVPNLIFTSTTSTFGKVIQRDDDETQHARLGKRKKCIWLNEDTQAIPRNIYGITKVSGEQLCFLAADLSRKKKHGGVQLNCVVLRTSRFFLEGDDDENTKNSMGDCNLKVNELLYRRLDLSDLVDGHVLAMKKAAQLSGEIFVLSAPPPFTASHAPLIGEPEDVESNQPSPCISSTLNTALDQFRKSTPSKRCPQGIGAAESEDDEKEVKKKRNEVSVEEIYKGLGWKLPVWFDRLYDSAKAVDKLGWRPQFTWASQILATWKLTEGGEERREVEYLDICSDLHRAVGKKSYHDDGRQYAE